MSEPVYLVLFPFISICSLASFLFSKSIRQNAATAFAKTFRNAKRSAATEEDILALIPAIRSTMDWSRVTVALIAWPTYLIAMVIRSSRVFDGLPTDTQLTLVRTCDAAAVISVIMVVIFSVWLLMDKDNTYLGFR